MYQIIIYISSGGTRVLWLYCPIKCLSLLFGIWGVPKRLKSFLFFNYKQETEDMEELLSGRGSHRVLLSFRDIM